MRVYTTADGIGSSAVNDLLYDSRGFLWFGTRDGLSRFDGYRFINYKLGTGETATSPSISQIIERRNGEYLIVVQNGNVYRFTAETTVSESPADGSLTLNSEKVLEKVPGKLLEDREGHLWSSSNEGLSRISETATKFIVEPVLKISMSGEAVTFIVSYLEDSEGIFWVSTDRGLIRMDKRGQILAHYQTPPTAVMRSFLNYLYIDHAGRIWVMSKDGLFIIKPDVPDNPTGATQEPLVENIKNRLPERPGEIVKFSADAGFSGQVVPALHETADGRVWMASDNGLIVFDGTGFRRFGVENGIGEYLTDIAEDTDGNLWVGSLSGIFKLVLNGFSTFNKADGLGRTDIAAIYQNSASEIFTAEGDWFVSRFDGERFVSAKPNLDETLGPPLWTSNISFLDSRNDWWFLTEKKIVSL